MKVWLNLIKDFIYKSNISLIFWMSQTTSVDEIANIFYIRETDASMEMDQGA